MAWSEPRPDGVPGPSLTIGARGTLGAGRSGGIGRRSGLKLRGPQGRQGSNPCSGTIDGSHDHALIASRPCETGVPSAGV